MLPGEVVNAIGLIRLTPPDADPFCTCHHAGRLSVTEPHSSLYRATTTHHWVCLFYLIGTGVLNAIRPASVMR